MGESAQGAGQRKKEEAPRLPGREMTSMNQQAQRLALGIDIGSTTAKVVLLEDGRVIFEQYQRHFSQVRQKTLELLEEAAPYIKDRPFTAAISGSAGLGLARGRGCPSSRRSSPPGRWWSGWSRTPPPSSSWAGRTPRSSSSTAASTSG